MKSACSKFATKRIKSEMKIIFDDEEKQEKQNTNEIKEIKEEGTK